MQLSILFLFDCLSTFSTTPIANVKTNSDVEPAEINGSGKPVGGIEPLNLSYCIINLDNFCSSTLYMFG